MRGGSGEPARLARVDFVKGRPAGTASLFGLAVVGAGGPEDDRAAPDVVGTLGQPRDAARVVGEPAVGLPRGKGASSVSFGTSTPMIFRIGFSPLRPTDLSLASTGADV